jgi:hypothetical protein
VGAGSAPRENPIVIGRGGAAAVWNKPTQAQAARRTQAEPDCKEQLPFREALQHEMGQKHAVFCPLGAIGIMAMPES